MNLASYVLNPVIENPVVKLTFWEYYKPIKMATMKALRQLEYAKPLQVIDVPTPRAESGTAVVRILASNIVSYMKDIYNGKRQYPYPTPLTTGTSAIGRIHELGPDSTSLQKDQLVLVSSVIRSRDDPSHIFLTAIFSGVTPGSQKLMSHFRDGSYAEYMSVPLESCLPFNEQRLLKSIEEGGLGYQIEDLLHIPKVLVPYGGMADIQLRPGETIIVAPATGGFGGAAVHCALSMGARVIAMGRNKEILRRVSDKLGSVFPSGRLVTVAATGNVEEEIAAIQKAAGGTPIDAFFDISPPQATDSTHFQAAIMCLRHGARVSMMGGQGGNVGIPHMKIMSQNITLKGKWMYERQDVTDLMRLVENGHMVLGKQGGLDPYKAFELEDWQNAFDFAEENMATMGAYFKI